MFTRLLVVVVVCTQLRLVSYFCGWSDESTTLSVVSDYYAYFRGSQRARYGTACVCFSSWSCAAVRRLLKVA